MSPGEYELIEMNGFTPEEWAWFWDDDDGPVLGR